MTYLLGRDDPVPRLRPSEISGIVAVLGAGVVILALQFASGVPRRTWGSSPGVLTLTEIVPFAVAAAFLVAFVGWSQWDAVWRDPFRLPVPRLVCLLTLVGCAGVLALLLQADWAAVPRSTLPLLVLAAVLAGFTHELALRGVLLRSLRVRRRPEIIGVLWTTVVSVLVQLAVLALASTALTVSDVGAAVGMAALCYLVRRMTRTLAAAVVLHACWSLGTLIERVHGSPDHPSVDARVAAVGAILALFALALTLRGDRTRRALVDPRLA